MKKLLITLALPFLLTAQPTIAPATEPVGRAEGENRGAFNVRNSFETGWRWNTVDGNRDRYRSDVNFGNGIRLLQGNFSLHARDVAKPGDGWTAVLDELTLSTQGLGNDPYQMSSLRLGKRRLYRYTMLWRSSEYFNPAIGFAPGLRLRDTTRTLQDHDFTLFPGQRFSFFGGYSRNRQDGMALASTQAFDTTFANFGWLEDVNRQQQEYRLGSDLRLRGLRLILTHGQEFFRETPGVQAIRFAGQPALPEGVVVRDFRQAAPWDGTTPFWRAALFAEKSRLVAVNARFTYSSGRRGFLFDESILGSLRTQEQNRQTIVSGNASRPVATGALTFSFFPNDRIQVVNHSAFHHSRMNGDNRLRQLDGGSLFFTERNFQFLGIRNITNQTTGDVRLSKWLAVQSSYQLAERRVRSIEQLPDDPKATGQQLNEQSNRLQAGTLGMRLTGGGLTAIFDAELGRNDRPFTPLSERNYHTLGARGFWKRGTLRIDAQARTNYNFNSTSLFRHSSFGRTWQANASWTPNARLAVDGGYQKLHLDTFTGLAYFVNFELVEGNASRYISNIHASHLGLRLSPHRRFDLYAGLNYTRDTGDGRNSPYGDRLFVPIDGFQVAQTLPLRFFSPMARLSWQWREKLRWNVAWQHYGYEEQFIRIRDYRAHTGYVGLQWSF
jgi:hypothetical protein